MSHIRKLSVFAVEDDSAQLVWREAQGDISFRSGDASVEVVAGGGPGAVMLTGLEPGTEHWVAASADGREVAGVRLTTLPELPGEEFCRFSTLNDLHLGALHFGVIGAPHDSPDNPDPFPFRCARSGVDEAAEWGAEAVVVKGDAVDVSTEENWREVAELHEHAHAPMWITMGNHEVKVHNEIEPALGAKRAGVELVDRIRVHDLAGIRIVLVNTSIPGKGHGEITPLAPDVFDACATDLPVFIATHHNFMPRNHPSVWPPGIPAREGRPFMKELARVNPRAFVSSGHTHRNRRRYWGPIVATEVASSKDYPGVWGGYVVHESGIRQVVRRVSEPSCIAWTERSRRAGFYVWGAYSPGWLTHRSFNHLWPSLALRRP